jgi:hypothetical protein
MTAKMKLVAVAMLALAGRAMNTPPAITAATTDEAQCRANLSTCNDGLECCSLVCEVELGIGVCVEGEDPENPAT